MGPPLQGMYPLIRPSVRTGASSPLGEGFGSAQIGRNLVLCGTFEYIYWELGRSAPVGGAGGPDVPFLQGRGWESAPSSGPPGHLPPEGKAFGGMPPHPSRLRRATFPPGGRLLRGAPSSIWPDGQPSFQKGKALVGRGPHSSQGEGLKNVAANSPAKKLTRN